MDDLDFLADAGTPAPNGALARIRVAESLEAVRGDLLDWAAGALHNRRGHTAAYRGKKGLAQCRQDLDFHLRHLHAELAAGGGDLATYARWVLPMFAVRGQAPGDVRAGVQVLVEALLRFLPADHSETAAALLGAGFAEPVPGEP